MSQKIKDEYYFLTEKLEEVGWALKGECNDIDCDKYIYRNLLKKRYKPILKHNFSCIKSLKMEKSAILRILSQERYKKYRYINCHVCKKTLDKLSNKSTIVSFTRRIKSNQKGYCEWKGIWTHKKCSSKVEAPSGWKKWHN
jgi:hypothetical protein